MGKSTKGVLTATLACGLAAQAELKVGDAAPDFTLPATTGNQIRLSQYRGKQNVVLAFVVAAFTGG
jgi:peroxiredoxin Q/BCP